MIQKIFFAKMTQEFFNSQMKFVTIDHLFKIFAFLNFMYLQSKLSIRFDIVNRQIFFKKYVININNT